MPFDGIVLSNVKNDVLKLVDGRIDRIYQVDNDELVFYIRGGGENHKLLLTSSNQNPRIHFTYLDKDNPMTPPNFCMVLRKHLQSGRITKVEQPFFERILEIYVESMDEMGDLSEKRLIIEIMGRHSNIILIDSNGIIIDSIKRVPLHTSSVRQVLPGLEYEYPPRDKINPLELNKDDFVKIFTDSKDKKLQEGIFHNYNGISPIVASEICLRANLNPSNRIGELEDIEINSVYNEFKNIMDMVSKGEYDNYMYLDKNSEVVDFHSYELEFYKDKNKIGYDNISKLIEDFYRDKDSLYRTRQKTQDLRRIVKNHIDRTVNKLDAQLKSLRDAKKMDKYRLYGELITSNIHQMEIGMDSFTTINFYDEDMAEIEIPLDKNKGPAENAQRYFSRYNKLKRTNEMVGEQLPKTKEELYYLESILDVLENKLDEKDIAEIRAELEEEGYIKKRRKDKGRKEKSSKITPMHFKSSDGVDIYVGKNNTQNDWLTMKFASSEDIWLHTKDIPGSHVIIRKSKEISPETIEEAANLAAYFSQGKKSSNVPVDFVEKKHVRKPRGAKPGMVIYDSHNTVYITPDIGLIKKLNINNHNI